MRIISIIIFSFFSIKLMAAVSVGSSPGSGNCTYGNIQDAINSGESEIRVLNNQVFNEHLFINRSVIIKGGYNTCLLAQLDIVSTTQTVLDADNLSGFPSSLAVINITDSTTGLPSIKLYNFIMQDSNENAITGLGGHGIDIGNSDVFLEIFNSVITNNSAADGGGIYVDNPANVSVFLNDTSVTGNTAIDNGGGIYCGNNNTNIIIQNNSAVANNSASNGGGIYSSSCNVTVSSGVDVNSSIVLAGIMNNTATNNGGGIYADFGADISLYGNKYGNFGLLGNSTQPVTLVGNTAGVEGGGMYIDRNSRVIIEDGLIQDNSANNGGAFRVNSFSQLDIKMAPKSSCWNDNKKCSILAQNIGISRGGVFDIEESSLVNVSQTYLYNNRADFATVSFVSSSGSILSMKNNSIYRNGNSSGDLLLDQHLMIASLNSRINLYHNTIANNPTRINFPIFSFSADSTLEVKNSIISNFNLDILSSSNAATVLANCVLVNEDMTLAGVGIVDGETAFVDTTNDDYHLSSISQALDLCAPIGNSISELDFDIEGRVRPIDNDVMDMFGIADAGAYEANINQDIFINGFE